MTAYGPLPLSTLNNLFGIHAPVFDAAIAELEGEEQVVLDTFTAGVREPEICRTENLEILLRMMRRARQPAFTPLACEKLPLFLATLQGLTRSGEAGDDLQHSLDSLFGYPAPCAAWEEYILPARVKPFFTAQLDSLLQSTGLVWFGCGNRKTSFCFREDLELFMGEKSATAETRSQLARFFPDPKGRYCFFDIAQASGLDSAALTEHLWPLVWRGWVSNDSYAVLRKGIEHNFKPLPVGGDGTNSRSRRRGFSRWQASRPLSGAFSLLAPPAPDSEEHEDALDSQELAKDRVRQLLLRYGILFRELLGKELPELQWKNIYRTLRLMDLSGELLSGYFFEDIAGPQFLSPAAYRMLRRLPDDEEIFWLNACDPASLCGLGPEPLRRQLPRRIATTFLVYHGTRLRAVLHKNGRELEIRVDPNHPRLGDYLQVCRDLLTREFQPLKIIAVETINGVAANRSTYRERLMALGFMASHKGLELRKIFR